MDWFILFWKISHAPIPANTIKIEKNKNDISVFVDACSDTESVSISVVIKKGFAALRYRNVGKLIMPEERITRPAIMTPPKIAKLLRNCALLLIFLKRLATIRNAVQPIRKNPLRLEAKAIPVFSNDIVIKMNAAVKTMEAHMMKLLSFLRNGSARKKTPIGNMKNSIPPHEARPNASKMPAPTIFARDIQPLSDFMPLRSR
tara:strand:+ start:97 stop:702 length:606 start_codon:yes stop_codon:yes gene_type:complete